eukprot:CAMPEP_0203682422 /NCGR_PEP_ID=MMETSP0090-20130426/45733_1 /ASSEMBLY_ACC=CAM_ASM_001088 /TAXON_ID=426623 /ORGANISM="Chaetoceros affinis, Strain CCMP159" /LENGTH=403 /DNA_ID=CAMNT_0050551331 /DNA_START=555 /DNA_END=1766 /DNA_ORIENTATION=+
MLAKKALSKKSSDGFNILEQKGNDNIIECSNRSDSNSGCGSEAENVSNKTIPTKDPDDSFTLQKDSTKNSQLLSLPTLSPNKVYILQFDGGSRGNPGVSGCGMVLFDSESQLEVWSGFKYLNEGTNNIAEYCGLLDGLKFSKMMGVKDLIAEGDSKLVVNQINGIYQVKKQHLKPLYQEVLSLIKQYRSFQLNYIPRSENFRADQLANIAMDTKSSSDIFSQYTICSEGGERERYSQVEKLCKEDKVRKDSVTELPHAKLSCPNTNCILKLCISSNISQEIHGAGLALYDGDNGEKLWNGRYFIPESVSSNIASYMTVVFGLRCALTFGARNIEVEAKSSLVINQMTGKYRVKSDKIVPFHASAMEMAHKFESFNIKYMTDHEAERFLKSESQKAMKLRLSEV